MEVISHLVQFRNCYFAAVFLLICNGLFVIIYCLNKRGSNIFGLRRHFLKFFVNLYFLA